MERLIHQTAVLPCPPETAFGLFTSKEHLEKWLSQSAEVEAKMGGKFELFWNPEDPQNDSTIGCKVLALTPNQFVNFEWKGPKQFKHFMNEANPLTNVTVLFNSTAHGTEVHLLHTGWRNSPQWEEARQYFIRAWTSAFDALKKYAAGFEVPEKKRSVA